MCKSVTVYRQMWGRISTSSKRPTKISITQKCIMYTSRSQTDTVSPKHSKHVSESPTNSKVYGGAYQVGGGYTITL